MNNYCLVLGRELIVLDSTTPLYKYTQLNLYNASIAHGQITCHDAEMVPVLPRLLPLGHPCCGPARSGPEWLLRANHRLPHRFDPYLLQCPRLLRNTDWSMYGHFQYLVVGNA
jgi:hypothetical protein